MDSTSEKKSNSISVYLLAACIALLIGSNAYLYFKFKNENNETVQYFHSEKLVLEQEIDQLETRLRASKVVAEKLENIMEAERIDAEKTIKELREKFNKGVLNSQELKEAKQEVITLRNFLNKYQISVDSLKKVNATLNNRLNDADKQIKILNNQKSALNKKIEENRDFQVQQIEVIAYKVKANRKKVAVSKANTAEILEISFNILPNDWIEPKQYPIYVRIFDPLGNLVVNENDTFLFKNERLQYSLSTDIDYQDGVNGTYVMQWKNPHKFEKGEYTILLYGMSHIIAEKRITLK